jgi:hypothetical protein
VLPVGALDLAPEILDSLVDRGLIEVLLCAVADQGEAEIAQGVRHQPSDLIGLSNGVTLR